MCGISGIYSFNNNSISLDEITDLTNSLHHRGPDGGNCVLLKDDKLALGQRRLAILDLSENGSQPMSYANGKYWITYNGEIFNFQEIRNQLIGIGYNFISDTDTEVILAAYIEWGENCLNQFNGMWAFAIWDTVNQELFLARDRFGIKPLYYTLIDNDKFVFASETRAFKFIRNFNREIDKKLLNYNFNDPYALEGLGYTIFKGIFQLLPGHVIKIKKDLLIKQKRWWSIKDNLTDVPKAFQDQSEKFYQIFKDSCKLRLISDVPIGTALSGGLDSTAVYSTINYIISKEKNGRINNDSQRAFTAVFPGLPQDEKEYALKAVNYTKGNIHLIEPDEDELIKRIETETELCDFISVSPITAISSVYKGMREAGIVVSLDGHGVDEMMYGYRDMVYSLYNDALWNKDVNTVSQYEDVLLNMYHSGQIESQKDRFRKQREMKSERERSLKFAVKKILGRKQSTHEFLPADLPSLSDKPYDFSEYPLEERMLYYEFFQHTLPALLRNFDRAGMINSVEIRMPFMDWRLVTYVFSLPVESKIGNGYTKRILREAMQSRMDEDLRTRRFKVGINSPIDHWMNGPLKEWALDNVNDRELRNQAELSIKKIGIIENNIVREIWQDINLQIIK